MAQNIYDRLEFFESYSRLPRSVEGLDGAPEWPAMRSMLPPLSGLDILDLGCGFGWFCRWARDRGAARVLGLDLSENMLKRAHAETSDAAIAYWLANLEELDLPEGAFDLVYSSLAFHYVEDAERLYNQIHRALKPGHLVFSTEHPIYMAPTMPGWATNDRGEKTWPVNSYSMEGPRIVDWFVKDVLKHHRTIGTTLNLLIRSGFTIRHVEEFAPSLEQIEADPALAEEAERPAFLLVAAVK